MENMMTRTSDGSRETCARSLRRDFKARAASDRVDVFDERFSSVFAFRTRALRDLGAMKGLFKTKSLPSRYTVQIKLSSPLSFYVIEQLSRLLCVG
jgi:hypothetical protein